VEATQAGNANYLAVQQLFTVQVVAPPAPPVVYAAVAGDSKVALYLGLASSVLVHTGYSVSVASPDGSVNVQMFGTNLPLVLGGLTNGSDYRLTICPQYSTGSGLCAVVEKVTPTAFSPVAVTDKPSAISITEATMNGYIQSHGIATQASFEYGTSDAYGSTIAATGVIGQVPSLNPAFQSVVLGSLVCGTTYHYRLKAWNANGTSYGADQTVTTNSCPSDILASPVITSVVAGPGAAKIYFSGNWNAGTRFTAVSSPGNIAITGTSSPLTVLGLDAGQSYTFRVQASRDNDISEWSEASAAVTPSTVQILIVNHTSGDAATAAAGLASALAGQGNITTVTTVPADLSSFTRIYDFRVFSEISSGEMTQYLQFLNAYPGNSLYLAGENGGFMTRNNSVFAFVTMAGGGTLTWGGSLYGEQTLYEPFNHNASSVTFRAAGAVLTSGTGSFGAFSTGSQMGSVVYFKQGTLANAPQGSLTIVLDINLTDVNAQASEQSFAQSAVQVMAAGGLMDGVPEVPVSLSLASDVSTVRANVPFSLTATLDIDYAGAVEFFNGTVSLGSVPVQNGVATLALPGLPVGVYSYTAKFSPADNSFGAAKSSSVNVDVQSWAPTQVQAMSGDLAAAVYFTQPALPAGLYGLDYRATSVLDGIAGQGSSSPIMVSGLVANTTYRFYVQAFDGTYYSDIAEFSNSILAQRPTSPGGAIVVAPVGPVAVVPAVAGIATGPLLKGRFLGEQLQLDLVLARAGSTELEIRNVQGMLLQRSNLGNMAVGQAHLSMEIGQLQSGLYLLSIRQNGQTVASSQAIRN